MNERETPRDRLIDTAAELFYDCGLPNVGINEVTKKAGVARMTLYNNFSSKEALALAAFERQAEARRAFVEERLQQVETPLKRVEAMFDVAETLATKATFKGCAFINVALQDPKPNAPLHALVRAHKLWIRSKFRDIARDAGHREADTASQQLLALWDGSIIEAFIQGGIEPIRAAKLAAVILLDGRV